MSSQGVNSKWSHSVDPPSKFEILHMNSINQQEFIILQKISRRLLTFNAHNDEWTKITLKNAHNTDSYTVCFNPATQKLISIYMRKMWQVGCMRSMALDVKSGEYEEIDIKPHGLDDVGCIVYVDEEMHLIGAEPPHHLKSN